MRVVLFTTKVGSQVCEWWRSSVNCYPGTTIHTHTALIPCGYFFLANEFAAAAALLATVPGKKEVTVGK